MRGRSVPFSDGCVCDYYVPLGSSTPCRRAQQPLQVAPAMARESAVQVWRKMDTSGCSAVVNQVGCVKRACRKCKVATVVAAVGSLYQRAKPQVRKLLLLPPPVARPRAFIYSTSPRLLQSAYKILGPRPGREAMPHLVSSNTTTQTHRVL